MLLADESVDFAIISKLRELDFPVISITETRSGISDDKVLELAVEQDLLLITEDKDFGELTFRLKLKHCGILLIRLSDTARPDRINLAVQAFIPS